MSTRRIAPSPQAGSDVQGQVFVLLAAAGFATLGIFSKLFYEHGGDSFTLVVFRLAGTAVVLGAVVFARGRGRASRQTMGIALAFGVFQLGANVALLEGFARAQASLVVLLFYVYPLIVALTAAVLLDEELGPARLAGLALGLGGVALAVGVPTGANRAGIALGLAAGAFTAAFIVGGRFLMTRHRLEPVELTTLGYLGPALLLLVAAGFRGLPLPADAKGWAAAAGLIVIASIAPLLLFYTGVKMIGAGRASLLATAEPVLAVLLAYAILGESLAALQLAGGGLVVAAIVVLNVAPGARSPVAQPTAAGGDLVAPDDRT